MSKSAIKKLYWTKNSLNINDSKINLSSKSLKEITNYLNELKNIKFDYNKQINKTNISSLTMEMKDLMGKYLDNTYGFFIINNLDLNESNYEDKLKTFWLLSIILGNPCKQNINNELIVVVKDYGKSMNKGGRYHQTREGGSLHSDSPQWVDVPKYIALMCINEAYKGGESLIANALDLHEYFKKQYSDLLDELYKPFHFDKRGEYKNNENPTTFAPIFEKNNQYISFRYLREYIDDGHKLEKLTQKQKQVLNIIDNYLNDKNNVVVFRLNANKIIFANNYRIIHGRTDFIDNKQLNMTRLYLRIWLKNGKI